MWSGPNNSFEPTQQSGAAQFSRSAEMACGLFMKFRFVFALALFGCFARAVESGEPGLEHERIYASSGVELVAGPINRYLMFYPDGVVIGATSKGTPQQVKPWFSRDNQQVGQGHYELRQNRLTFLLRVETGTLEYVGVVEDERLLMDVLSLVDHKRRQYVYLLVESGAEQRVQGATR